MADMQLTKTRIQAGVWEGVLTGAERLPDITVSHLSEPVTGASVKEDPDNPGQYFVRVPIPAELLSDGVQTFVISDKATNARLASFAIITGQPMDADFRAEMDLLRAELDMLKRAFRRHCVETM
ncbi:hypothetical protein [Maritimibacter fusiformis]|uniref:Uncharacterized protein n=1 Tax=Maritimibacter fusiformis TaxID=2603819 RepID=A0A5D0RM27_9RHOB|nr:hypothetical protein [Maritimibacter fusiformis]TYB81996.1 hypothetical protein FVF75_04470 [Maritimibacter fusiformis]